MLDGGSADTTFITRSYQWCSGSLYLGGQYEVDDASYKTNLYTSDDSSTNSHAFTQQMFGPNNDASDMFFYDTAFPDASISCAGTMRNCKFVDSGGTIDSRVTVTGTADPFTVTVDTTNAFTADLYLHC